MVHLGCGCVGQNLDKEAKFDLMTGQGKLSLKQADKKKLCEWMIWHLSHIAYKLFSLSLGYTIISRQVK